MNVVEAQNITLALPKDVLKRARLLAVRRGTSVSRMLTEALIEMVVREDQYEQARAHHFVLLGQSRGLGTRGRSTYSREELHERPRLAPCRK